MKVGYIEDENSSEMLFYKDEDSEDRKIHKPYPESDNLVDRLENAMTVSLFRPDKQELGFMLSVGVITYDSMQVIIEFLANDSLVLNVDMIEKIEIGKDIVNIYFNNQ